MGGGRALFRMLCRPSVRPSLVSDVRPGEVHYRTDGSVASLLIGIGAVKLLSGVGLVRS